MVLSFSLHYFPLRSIHTLLSRHIPSDFPSNEQLSALVKDCINSFKWYFSSDYFIHKSLLTHNSSY